MRLRRTSNALALLLSLAVSLPVPAQSIALPDIGDPSQQYLSGSEGHRLGQAALQEIRDHNLVIEDVQLNEYLASVGQTIAAYAQNDGYPFTYFWINGPTINAFAAPGGFIGIYSGLLLTTQNEDELAGVIAHETAHVYQHHIARTFADAQNLSIPVVAAMLAGAVLAAASRSPVGSQLGQAAMVGTMGAVAQHQINFTRANEEEADRVGSQLLNQSGFDPNGMANFFARLERLPGGLEAQIPEFLRDHPIPRHRIAETQDRQPRSPAPRLQRDKLAYNLAKVRMQVLTTTNTTDLIRQFETALAKGDYADETAGRYGYALALKQAGRYDEAQQQIDRLRKAKPDNLAFRLEEAEIALAKGDKTQAWRLFNDASRLYPDDYILAMHYGYALSTQGDPHQAMQLLQPFLRRRPSDVSLYATYAQAAQRAGDITTTHATLAEYYYLNGELPQAIEQAQLGLNKSGATPYQQAQLHARLRQYKAELTAWCNDTKLAPDEILRACREKAYKD
jgi:predicted Zn-dependent protease